LRALLSQLLSALRARIHAPQHFLYFLPLPQVHGSFLPIFGVARLIRGVTALSSEARAGLAVRLA